LKEGRVLPAQGLQRAADFGREGGSRVSHPSGSATLRLSARVLPGLPIHPRPEQLLAAEADQAASAALPQWRQQKHPRITTRVSEAPIALLSCVAPPLA
jgi:hypothetical protein